MKKLLYWDMWPKSVSQETFRVITQKKKKKKNGIKKTQVKQSTGNIINRN